VPKPNDEPNVNQLDSARSELRESIENSRELLRQSRMLIELSESDAVPRVDDLALPLSD
jgi:hypothetical protein